MAAFSVEENSEQGYGPGCEPTMSCSLKIVDFIGITAPLVHSKHTSSIDRNTLDCKLVAHNYVESINNIPCM